MKSKKVKIRVWLCADTLFLTEREADNRNMYAHGGWEEVASSVRTATLYTPRRKAALARGEGEK